MKQFYIKCAAAAAVIIISLVVAARLFGTVRQVSNSDAKDIADAISGGNVHIASELIDLKKHEVCDCTMVSKIDAPSLARQFLGSGAKKRSATQYFTPNGSFSVTDTRFTYTPDTPIFEADTKSVTISTAVDIALRLCDEYGIDYTDGKTEVSMANGGYYVSIMKTLYELPMFNNALVMDIRSDGLHSVSGVDFRIEQGSDTMREAKPVGEALTEFMRECTDPSRETIITDLKLGYILNDPDASGTVLRPVWRIIVENNSVYYIDA